MIMVFLTVTTMTRYQPITEEEIVVAAADERRRIDERNTQVAESAETQIPIIQQGSTSSSPTTSMMYRTVSVLVLEDMNVAITTNKDLEYYILKHTLQFWFVGWLVLCCH